MGDIGGVNNINLALEANDILKASTLTFKFVAFKTPIKLNDLTKDIRIPKRFFFTFKFFTFPTSRSELLVLRGGNSSGEVGMLEPGN
jgi:hypothetical protein